MIRLARSVLPRYAARLLLAALIALSFGPSAVGKVAQASSALGQAASPLHAAAALRPEAYLPEVVKAPAGANPGGPAPVYHYRIVNAYAHDASAFTEGLFYDGGYLYESTGLNGESSLRKVELTTGRVLMSRALASQYFGEGIALVGNRIWQLTYTTKTGFIYLEATFSQVDSFTYPAAISEGWGLTYDGTSLLESDGSANIHVINPQTFAEIGQVHVTDQGRAVTNLNELEYVQGQIYANILSSDRIAVIAPATGQVTAWIDLTGLRAVHAMPYPNGVLNGIAYDAQGGRLFVTGKNWSYLYQIQVVP